jgi:hypothetical protein
MKIYYIISIFILILLLVTFGYILYNKKNFSGYIMYSAVFDLDETFGHFVQFGILIDAIEDITNRKITNDEFEKILDLYPELLRPNILNILKFLKQKKKNNICDNVLIYTNNQGPLKWTESIKNYLERKLDYPLFDQTISAYKVNGRQREAGRTSHTKKYSDFLKCTNYPKNTKVCFVDDQYHDGMKHKNVTYLHVKPYTYSFPTNELIKRYINSNIHTFDYNPSNQMQQFMNTYHYNIEDKDDMEQNVDEIVGKKMLTHINDFLKKKSKNKTLRRNKCLRKNIHGV